MTTDFGWADGYVGAMKGVILGIEPTATVVDISHDITPQDIREAAFVLYTIYRYFPAGTVHVVVVDPGVGSERRAIAVGTGRAYFVAPDNGVLSYVVAGEEVEMAVHLTEPRYWRPEVSRTFHGRDIFAPVAAHLAQGVPLEDLGESLRRLQRPPYWDLVTFPLPRPQSRPDGALVGHILHIDRFGNLITSFEVQGVEGKELGVPLNARTVIEIGGRRIEGVRSTYTEVRGKEPLVLIGSSGHLEVAVSGGSAALMLRSKVGDEVVLRSLGAESEKS